MVRSKGGYDALELGAPVRHTDPGNRLIVGEERGKSHTIQCTFRLHDPVGNGSGNIVIGIPFVALIITDFRDEVEESVVEFRVARDGHIVRVVLGHSTAAAAALVFPIRAVHDPRRAIPLVRIHLGANTFDTPIIKPCECIAAELIVVW
jgi:hypothetical protein